MSSLYFCKGIGTYAANVQQSTSLMPAVDSRASLHFEQHSVSSFGLDGGVCWVDIRSN